MYLNPGIVFTYDYSTRGCGGNNGAKDVNYCTCDTPALYFFYSKKTVLGHLGTLVLISFLDISRTYSIIVLRKTRIVDTYVRTYYYIIYFVFEIVFVGKEEIGRGKKVHHPGRHLKDK
jgi:hypothetical protein